MSIKKETEKELKAKLSKDYSKLKKSNNQNFKLYNLNFGKIFVYFLIGILLVTIYTFYIDFQFLKFFEVDFKENVKTFTTGIITLVSMNLFVTNLLFTHLREDRDDIQSIIDRRVNFKFLTYFGFSIIFWILLLYFLSPSFHNNNVSSNILIFIFANFLFYIIQLVKLYDVVFNFIHKEKRLKIIKNELEIEFFNAYYRNTFKDSFNSKYLEFLKKNDFLKYIKWNSPEDLFHFTHESKNPVYLRDINVKELDNKMKKINDKRRFYHPVEFDQEFPADQVINSLSFSNKNNLKLNKYYSFSNKPYFDNDYQLEHLERLLNKVSDNTVSNDSSNLNYNLKNMEMLYEQYLDLEI
ncbi:hypothetical protein [uncultured Christiangramia sp.]|uniref:hypothetical protein n=1 Tax=Christiangramia sp. 3-2217-3z TaxID=3417564 RepID=UPI0026231EFE|nr:hypothetical protein [uncultured Christiangramia sp.]